MSFPITGTLGTQLQVTGSCYHPYFCAAAKPQQGGPSLQGGSGGIQISASAIPWYLASRMFWAFVIPGGLHVTSGQIQFQMTTSVGGDPNPSPPVYWVTTAGPAMGSPTNVVVGNWTGPFGLIASQIAAISTDSLPAGQTIWVGFSTYNEVLALLPPGSPTPGSNGQLIEMFSILPPPVLLLDAKTIKKIGDAVGVTDSANPILHAQAFAGPDQVGIRDSAVGTPKAVSAASDGSGVRETVVAKLKVFINDGVGTADAAFERGSATAAIESATTLTQPSRFLSLTLGEQAQPKGPATMTQTLSYFVGDGPIILLQVLEPPPPDSGSTAPTPPDITGWTARLLLTPRNGGVPAISQSLYIADAASGVFGYAVPGGYLPGDTLPTVFPAGSFSLPATYDGVLVVKTAPPDGSPGEILTSEPVVIDIQKRS